MTFQQPTDSIRRRYESGKKLRERLPRAAQARWAPAPHRPFPLTTIATVNHGRVTNLLPEKYRRMQVSPFAFFRGAAVLMASDLATQPSTGLTVQLCGDAHVHNLGAYAASDGRLVFDINDFDETTSGPWEWDLKRLATSLVLAGGECGQSEGRCEEGVRAMVASYRQHLRAFALMPFATLARHLITRRGDERVLDDIFQAARRITPGRNLKKLTVKTRGRFRFHDRKPDLEHVPSRTATEVVHALQGYAVTLNASRRRTFERYRPADVAFKLVGTGSVGTRDYVVLLFGNDANDPLFMQVKQELPSCYASVLPAPRPRVVHQGRRVAEGQQMMQTASDPFLGYTRCGGHDYLVRQLADHQAGLGPTELKGGALLACGRLCGEVLAKGHARTTDAAALAGYVGGSAKLDTAIAAFAFAYTEQTKRDFRLFVRSPNYSSADYNGFRVNPGADVSFQWTSPPWTVLADYRGLLRGGGDGGEGGGTGRGGGGATGRGGDPSLEVRRFATLAEYSQATHQDQHSVKVDYDVFVNVMRLDAKDLRNVQKLYKAEDFDFSLKPGAAAVDRGVALANVTDGFTGEAPDLGALEVGQAPPHYGPRR